MSHSEHSTPLRARICETSCKRYGWKKSLLPFWSRTTFAKPFILRMQCMSCPPGPVKSWPPTVSICHGQEILRHRFCRNLRISCIQCANKFVMNAQPQRYDAKQAAWASDALPYRLRHACCLGADLYFVRRTIFPTAKAECRCHQLVS